MIDWSRLSDLRSDIGDNNFVEVVDLFLEEADEVISALTGLPDLLQVESRLHFLKGSALNLGLSDLAALCQTGERSAATGNAAAVDLPRVVTIYQISRQLLLSSLAKNR